MDRITWHASGERFFETGVDRGVLYVPYGAVQSATGMAKSTPIPWNGLKSVEETSDSPDIKVYYQDGVRFFARKGKKEFRAKLTAFTYPKEFTQYEGYKSVSPGFLFDEQTTSAYFHLAYRTLVGNDVQGSNFAYKLHLFYNLTATPSQASASTIASSVDVSDFTWDLVGIPQKLDFPSTVEKPAGLTATCHIVIDSRSIPAGVMNAIEEELYSVGMPSPNQVYKHLFSVYDKGDKSFIINGEYSQVYLSDPDELLLTIDVAGAKPTSDPDVFTIENIS